MKRATINPPMVSCSACSGSGKVPLSNELLLVLQTLRAWGPSNAPRIHKAMGAHGSVTGTNNNLEKLRELGLVSRFKVQGDRSQTYKAESKKITSEDVKSNE